MRQAVEEFGALHVLVNNAGILRDRTIVNMADTEWDDVIKVHMRGHFMPLRAAARYWRGQHKEGRELRPSVINFMSNVGAVQQPRAVELRRRQDRHHLTDDHRAAGAGTLRRARQRDRASGPYSAYPRHAGRFRGDDEAARAGVR